LFTGNDVCELNLSMASKDALGIVSGQKVSLLKMCSQFYNTFTDI